MERFIKIGIILGKTALITVASAALFGVGTFIFDLEDWIGEVMLVIGLLFLCLFLLFVLFIAASPFIVLGEKRRAQSAGSLEIQKSDIIAFSFAATAAVAEIVFVGLLFLISPSSSLTFPCDIVAFRPLTALEIIKDVLHRFDGFDLQLVLLFVGAIVVLSIIGILWFGGVLYFKRVKFIETKLLTLVLGMLVAVSVVALFGYVASLNTPRIKSRDGRRIADIKQVQLALELYRDANQERYPTVSGEIAQERWKNLRLILSPTLIPALPDDPCYVQVQNHQYDYRNSSDSESYVMRTILGNPNNPVFKSDDIDGMIMGIWCGEENKELEYCVQP